MNVLLIDDNPLRVLGVFANSTSREIEQNKAQLRAFARVGQEAQLALWLNGLSLMTPLPAVTEELLAEAQSQLALQADRDRYARFWFERDSDHAQEDQEALSLLTDNKVDLACLLWSKRSDGAAQKNLLLLAVLRDDWNGIAEYAAKCFKTNMSDFHLFMDEVANAFVEANGTQPHLLLEHFTKEPSKGEMRQVLVRRYKQALDEAIDSLNRTKTTDTGLLKKEIERLNEEMRYVEALQNLLGQDSITYSYYANEAAKTLLIALYQYSEQISSGHETKWAAKLAIKIWVNISPSDPDYNELLNKKCKIAKTKHNNKPDEERGCWWDVLELFFKCVLFYSFLFLIGKGCGLIKKKERKYDRLPYNFERHHMPSLKKAPFIDPLILKYLQNGGGIDSIDSIDSLLNEKIHMQLKENERDRKQE